MYRRQSPFLGHSPSFYKAVPSLTDFHYLTPLLALSRLCLLYLDRRKRIEIRGRGESRLIEWRVGGRVQLPVREQQTKGQCLRSDESLETDETGSGCQRSQCGNRSGRACLCSVQPDQLFPNVLAFTY